MLTVHALYLYAQVTCPKFQYIFLVTVSSGHLMSVLQEQPQSDAFNVICGREC